VIRVFRILERLEHSLRSRSLRDKGAPIMESLHTSSDVRELCKAVSEEKNPEQMMVLVDELIRVLDERQQSAAFL
jgi:hypothetical protein